MRSGGVEIRLRSQHQGAPYMQFVAAICVLQHYRGPSDLRVAHGSIDHRGLTISLLNLHRRMAGFGPNRER